jgi:hypothetical protein
MGDDMPTKRDIITDAFAELGLAEYIFDLQAEQLETAKRSLDRMMALWSGQGIVVSYPRGLTATLTMRQTRRIGRRMPWC